MRYIDVQKQMKTSIDVLQEATIDDYWNMDRFDTIRIAQQKATRKIFMWEQGRLTKKQDFARLHGNANSLFLFRMSTSFDLNLFK